MTSHSDMTYHALLDVFWHGTMLPTPATWFSEDAPPEWVTNGYQLKKTIKRLEAA